MNDQSLGNAARSQQDGYVPGVGNAPIPISDAYLRWPGSADGVDIELAYIGACFTLPEVLENTVLEPEDFENPKYAIIFQRVMDRHHRGLGVTQALLSADLPDEMTSIWRSTDDISAIHLWQAGEDAIRDHALRRNLRSAAIRINSLVEAPMSEDLVDWARKFVDDAVSREHKTVLSMKTDAVAILTEFRKELRLSPSCWPELDAVSGGFGPGRMYVVGARPGVGKSAFASHVAYDLAAHGSVIFSTMEMSKGEVYTRIVAQQAGVYYPKHGPLSEFNQAKESAFLSQHTRDIRVIDDGTQTVSTIRTAARSAARDGKVAGIVVDYLHLLHSTSGETNEVLRLGEITRSLKQMSKDFDCPVIALSQLNRATARGGDVPGLSDLRGSGAIEQDADMVIMLSRQTNEEGEFADKFITVTIAKNRHGQAFVTFDLDFEGQFFQLKSRNIPTFQ